MADKFSVERLRWILASAAMCDRRTAMRSGTPIFGRRRVFVPWFFAPELCAR
jgi:hypothetical protein